MDDSPETPDEPRPRRHQEYEDPHFHDEDEVVAPDDGPPRPAAPGKRWPVRRPPPPRRHYED